MTAIFRFLKTRQNWPYFGIFNELFVLLKWKFSSQCWMRLFLWFSNTVYLDKIDGHKVEKSSRSKIEFSKSKENNLSSLPTRFSLFPERKKKKRRTYNKNFAKLFYKQILTNFRVKIHNVSIFWHFLKFKFFCEIARTVFENYSKCRTWFFQFWHFH